jgi:hypothetical protein
MTDQQIKTAAAYADRIDVLPAQSPVRVKAVAYVGVWGLAMTEPVSQPILSSTRTTLRWRCWLVILSAGFTPTTG